MNACLFSRHYWMVSDVRSSADASLLLPGFSPHFLQVGAVGLGKPMRRTGLWLDRGTAVLKA
jgi:hypothetical protein